MKLKLLYYWERIRASYWFVPSLMLFAATLLSSIVVRLDTEFDTGGMFLDSWGYSGDSDGATAVLSTIAGSMITIAGVVFSIALVALSMASSQFGPRMLRNYIRDRVNQFALGVFVSTFLYCMLVLRTVRHESDSVAPFVPHLAVGLAVLLAVLSVFVLIYYIHHVAVHIQADTLIDDIHADLQRMLDKTYPHDIGESIEHAKNDQEDDQAGEKEDAATGHADLSVSHHFDRLAGRVCSGRDDYVEAIDVDALLSEATQRDLAVRIERRAGDYVVAGALVLSVWPGDKVDDATRAALLDCVIFGAQRTATQDIEFAVDQMVEIAARALSPGINDPFTAIVCIDRLGSALARLAQRALPPALRVDENGTPRVITQPVKFAHVLDAAFNALRQFAHGNAPVTIRMIEMLTEIEALATRSEDRAALERHAMMLMRSADAGLAEPDDRDDARRRYQPLLAALRRKRDL